MKGNGCNTFVIGPWGVRSELEEEPEAGLAEDRLLLKAVIVWDTPSARMNCSRSSMLVRPLAVCVSVEWVVYGF